MAARAVDKKTSDQKPVLSKKLIKLNLESVNKEEAIRIGGQLLVEEGYVTRDYINKMKEREQQMSTFMGNGIAIPHGTNKAKKSIKHTGLSVLQFPEGIDYGEGKTVYLVVSIAGKEDEHLNILQNLATICQDEEKVKELITTDKKKVIYDRLTVKEG